MKAACVQLHSRSTCHSCLWGSALQCIHFEAPMASEPPIARCLDSVSFNILIDEAFVERAATAREQVLIDSWRCQWHVRQF